MLSPEQPWQIDTEKLAKSIRRTTQGAKTEEDIKMAIAPLLRRAFREVEIDVSIKEQLR